jgi:hypothetical protein
MANTDVDPNLGRVLLGFSFLSNENGQYNHDLLIGGPVATAVH